ncbi:MAG: hypothetical protein AAB375_00350 [Patescibacteria group bacterium]|mgnify:CR=1 FL=1
MQEIYKVWVHQKGSAGNYVAELCNGVGAFLDKRSNLSSDAVPAAVLEMLAKRGQRFIGSMPDFHSQRFGNDTFFVITEPIVEEKTTECPKCRCREESTKPEDPGRWLRGRLIGG